MFHSLDDLTQIPILRTHHLKQSRPDELVMRGVDFAQCETVNTSGTSGTPLTVYLGPAEQRLHRIVAWRILFEHGFRWTDRTLEIRMALGKRFFMQKWGLAPKDWVSIVEPPESWARLLAERRHQVVVSCPSALEALARVVEELKLDIVPPRIIISDSEVLTPEVRRIIRRALGTDPVDVFGTVELSNFAWQCERRDRFHVSADTHIVEVAAPPGETGPMIVSALGMYTMPIIRYDTGDLAQTGTHVCGCGRNLPLLARMYGREADAVTLADGRQIFWPFFFEILSGYQQLRRWQVVQAGPRSLKIRMVLAERDASFIPRLRADLQESLPSEVELEFVPLDEIPLAPGEKLRLVIRA
jgi:phenylacetate-coenzyme A ligase PaaK-like adenylate-forming protein